MPSDSLSTTVAVSQSVYQHLTVALPHERTRQFLELLQGQGLVRLVLAPVEGQRATLDGVDLSPENLRKFIHNAAPHPVWWHLENEAIDLRNLDLTGASFRHADLTDAVLEGTNFSDVDFAGSSLAGADLSGTQLRNALLEDADLQGAVLRFAQGPGSVWEEANLQGADLWGATMEKGEFCRANLERAILEEADFQQANLSGVNLRGAVLRRTNLCGANLRGADLRSAILGETNLENAVLQDARLEDLDLSHCNLTHIYTSRAQMERTRFDREQLGGAIGEERDREYAQARKGYLVLERNFNELGDHDAARWSYLRRRRMEKWEARQKAGTAWKQGRTGLAMRSGLKYVGDQLVEWLCDYGESISRVVTALLAIYFAFIIIYGLTGTVVHVEHTPDGIVKTPTTNLTDLALFSLAAMTSPGTPPNFVAHRNEWAHVLAGSQTLVSIFLTGLMGFVAGNRIRR